MRSLMFWVWPPGRRAFLKPSVERSHVSDSSPADSRLLRVARSRARDDRHVAWLSRVGSLAGASLIAMRVAGVSVRERSVAALAEFLLAAGFEDTADALLVALDAEQDLVALSIDDREAILRVLDDPPIELAELHRVLLREQE